MSFGIRDLQELLVATVGEIRGTDTDDKEYDNIVDLWNYELRGPCTITTAETATATPWYSQAFDYWESEVNCPITDDGVLGGYGALTPMDSRDSNLFLSALKAKRPSLQFDKAADCGAGIGRVTKSLLMHRFSHVDLVEQSPRLIKAAPTYLGPEAEGRVTYVCEGLQVFAPAPNSYDVIWIQWVIGHLHDLDFISFFKRCAAGLRPGGAIILKDNCAQGWTFVVDKDDSSVARSAKYLRLLFALSGLNLILEAPQTDFPEELYPVHMFALTPLTDASQPTEAVTDVTVGTPTAQHLPSVFRTKSSGK